MEFPPGLREQDERMYQRGWEDALEAAATIVEKYARQDHPNAVTVCDLAATDIRKLIDE